MLARFLTVGGCLMGLAVASSARAECDGMQGFPGDTGLPRKRVAGHSIPYGGGGGRCTEDQAKKIGEAADCAWKRGLECLSMTNGKLVQKFTDALIKEYPVVVGCGDRCPGHNATTEGGPLIDSRTNLNPDYVDGASDDQLCETMFHEMLHVLGEGKDKKSHDKKSDRTYACGRYCAGCADPSTAMQDCLRCADTPEEKETCGHRYEKRQVPCDDRHCQGEHPANTAPCAGPCYEIARVACDGTYINGVAVVDSAGISRGTPCCSSCPSSQPHAYFPCSDLPNPASLGNDCSGLPYLCQKH